ncbi:hypothetical protein Pmani_002816 [Petrolisthes manimaculis]|uniref:Methyltransferase domain-containing protein n=1 Tax=Petrolisthes manimaculis TaxID=1843537 RepID=A0AAE1QH21_9EUCA|nr:hypothetical protein Pmani_002816 [Petrolisthes manimaculis]
MEKAEYKMEEGRVMGTEFTSKGNKHDRQQQGTRKYNSRSVKEESRGVALELHRLLTQPTTICHKMIRMGGRTCLGAYDGTKMVCLDNDMEMKARQCLVYSFGVGHDFTFDEQVQDLGCEVHSFDHDLDHEIYDYRIGPTAFFHKVRVGPKTGSYRNIFFSYCDNAAIGTGCDPPIRYQTFTDIRKSLGHERRRVDYLKFDIEGGEWEVLQQMLQSHSTRALLAAASHISIEIHLDAVLHMKTPEEKQNLLTTYLNTVQ